MRILVVEDEPEMARILQLGLQEEGHTVVAASNGLDALSIARQYEFDAVVLRDAPRPRRLYGRSTPARIPPLNPNPNAHSQGRRP